MILKLQFRIDSLVKIMRWHTAVALWTWWTHNTIQSSSLLILLLLGLLCSCFKAINNEREQISLLPHHHRFARFVGCYREIYRKQNRHLSGSWRLIWPERLWESQENEKFFFLFWHLVVCEVRLDLDSKNLGSSVKSHFIREFLIEQLWRLYLDLSRLDRVTFSTHNKINIRFYCNNVS